MRFSIVQVHVSSLMVMSFYLFDSHARNCLGTPDENSTVIGLEFTELD